MSKTKTAAKQALFAGRIRERDTAVARSNMILEPVSDDPAANLVDPPMFGVVRHA